MHQQDTTIPPARYHPHVTIPSTTFAMSDSDSDDDLFLPGGRVVIATHHDVASDSDSDFDNPLPAKPKRGRKPKSKPPSYNPRQPQTNSSVIVVNSDDDTPEVPLEKNSNDLRAESILENVNRLLNQGEDALTKQAEDMARREANIEVERQENIEREKERLLEVQRRNKAAQPVKQNAVKQGAPIKFKVQMGDNRMAVRVRTTDPLLRMLKPFCDKYGVDASTVVMKVDGEIVGEKDTAETLECDEGMQIDVEAKR